VLVVLVVLVVLCAGGDENMSLLGNRTRRASVQHAAAPAAPAAPPAAGGAAAGGAGSVPEEAAAAEPEGEEFHDALEQDEPLALAPAAELSAPPAPAAEPPSALAPGPARPSQSTALPLVSLCAHLSFLDCDTPAEFSQPCKPNFLVSILLPQSLGCVSSPGQNFFNPCITAHFFTIYKTN